MSIVNELLGIIAKYKPSKSILHNMVYLTSKYSKNLSWEITITGLYSKELEEIINVLIENRVVKICVNGRLTLDNCPEDSFDAREIVSYAVKQYLVHLTSRESEKLFEYK
ncbi:MAG: hypothetical protein J7L82_07225 [Staphylothermus sp.]|nr:hypothetical protein [Staphylothermus sp.]